jgi:hypothetical protein
LEIQLHSMEKYEEVCLCFCLYLPKLLVVVCDYMCNTCVCVYVCCIHLGENVPVSFHDYWLFGRVVVCVMGNKNLFL